MDILKIQEDLNRVKSNWESAFFWRDHQSLRGNPLTEEETQRYLSLTADKEWYESELSAAIQALELSAVASEIKKTEAKIASLQRGIDMATEVSWESWCAYEKEAFESLKSRLEEKAGIRSAASAGKTRQIGFFASQEPAKNIEKNERKQISEKLEAICKNPLRQLADEDIAAILRASKLLGE